MTLKKLEAYLNKRIAEQVGLTDKFAKSVLRDGASYAMIVYGNQAMRADKLAWSAKQLLERINQHNSKQVSQSERFILESASVQQYIVEETEKVVELNRNCVFNSTNQFNNVCDAICMAAQCEFLSEIKLLLSDDSR